jgi:hypothetical protein
MARGGWLVAGVTGMGCEGAADSVGACAELALAWKLKRAFICGNQDEEVAQPIPVINRQTIRTGKAELKRGAGRLAVSRRKDGTVTVLIRLGIAACGNGAMIGGTTGAWSSGWLGRTGS